MVSLSSCAGKVMGIDSYVLSPEETKQLYPLMNVDDIYGTLYSPMVRTPPVATRP